LYAFNTALRLCDRDSSAPPEVSQRSRPVAAIATPSSGEMDSGGRWVFDHVVDATIDQ
jgi:hypothetical protein